ncbi:MAG: ATP-binding protein [Ardenticatenaceae bacterium]|nr:ATP-binding protein [Ardenticatenaceae bacterium]
MKSLNIITHGHQAAGLDGELTVTAVFHPNRLVIELKDSGQPFDPRQAKKPTNLKDPLQKRAAGNLGIFLTMWGIDGFQYEQTHGYNHNIFIMQYADQKAHS